MIDITKLTQSDIGRAVVYKAHNSAQPEDGTITSFNESYIFVRFGHHQNGVACYPVGLTFLSGDEDFRYGTNR